MMNIGDLVRHKHLGCLGFVLGKKVVYSNIVMGLTKKIEVRWLDPRVGQNHYFPAFLELVE